jgi:hypothetical protein
MRKSGSLLATLLLASCAGAVESSKTEDNARRVVPVPICLKPMPRHAQGGVVAALSADDYWKMVLPTFDRTGGSGSTAAVDCAGRPLAQRDEPAAGQPVRGGAMSEVVLGSGPDEFKIVWLRLREFPDDTAAGPLALVRPREAHAEVYAIGHYKGRANGSRFGFERLASNILVTALDEGCKKTGRSQNCESNLTLYLSRGGRLEPSGRLAVARVQTNPSAAGPAEYQLLATPTYRPTSVRVVEKIVVRDASQNEIRRSDLERIFVLRKGELVSDTQSLWSQVVGEPSSSPKRSVPGGRE